MPWDFALILIVLSTVVPCRSAVRMRQLLARPQLTMTDRLGLYASTIAFQWLAMGVVGWRSYARGMTASELGLALGREERIIVAAGGLTILLALGQVVSLRYAARLPPERQGFLQQLAVKILPQNVVESLAFVALVSTVAVCEEFLYRGFIFAVLERATSSTGVAVAGSSLLFAVAHLYQGKRGMRTTFLVGLLFAVSRVWTGSVAPAVAAHLVVDLVAGLAAPRWFRRAAGGGEAGGSGRTGISL